MQSVVTVGATPADCSYKFKNFFSLFTLPRPKGRCLCYIIFLHIEVVVVNNENLIPLNKRTKSEQREIQSKGGKASGISRNFKGAIKNKLKENPEFFGQVAEMLFNETLSGNLKALDALVDLSGESVQREMLALKKKELKLKEEALKPDNTSSDDGFIEALNNKTEEIWND